MDQLLLGYLLGTLEDEERATVEKRLADDPRWQARLAAIDDALELLRSALPRHDPPSGLAERTCRLIFDGCDHPRRPCTLSPDVQGHSRSTTWRMFDLVAATCVAAALFLFVWPALHLVRVNAHVATCQQNLRDLGVAFVSYSDRNSGFFPQVPITGKLAVVGIYGPILAEAGLLSESRQIRCPAARSLPDGDGPGREIPTIEKLKAVPPDLVNQWASSMTRAGGYGYSLGYWENGQYHQLRNQGRSHFALAADTPPSIAPPWAFVFHGGRGRNVLFEDGRVQLLADRQWCGDDLFRNDAGWVAAGLRNGDSVIVSGATPPVVLERD